MLAVLSGLKSQQAFFDRICFAQANSADDWTSCGRVHVQKNGKKSIEQGLSQIISIAKKTKICITFEG